jgi:signal transduction histidine kinase
MRQGLSPTRRWARAVADAAGTADADEALSTLLQETIAATGAAAGSVLEEGSLRDSHGWAAEEAEAAAASVPGLLERLPRAEEWQERVLVARSAPGAGGAARWLLLAPLRVRELCIGALLLRFDAAEPPPPVQEAAAAFAGVVALLLENARLQEESRTAFQAREHFLTALNHELRTPANALLLNADLLRSGTMGEIPARAAQALEEAESNVRMMIAVLRRVLDLGQLGDQASPEREEILHPRDAVAALLRRMEPAAKRKNLALALYVPRTLPPLQTDADRFERILIHLLSNAVKYTSEGGVDVRLERGRRPAGSNRQEPVLVIRVTDTGCGIPPEQLERVLEPFAQVDEGARGDTPRRGVGLGLPLARQMARSLRGDLTLESTPGHGTTASLILPYHSL